jgi:hypothetical protein
MRFCYRVIAVGCRFELVALIGEQHGERVARVSIVFDH